MSPLADEPQGSEQAVESAPIAAESVMTEAPAAAEYQAASPVPAQQAAPVAMAPQAAAPAITIEPAQPAPAAAPAVPAPVAAPYRLPTDTLASIASGAGLQWVGSDAEKIRAVQEAMANEPKPMRVPRAPKPRAAIDDSPLVLVETKKDLSQVRLPFDA